MKYLVRVTETINHDYEIEATSEQDAIDIFHSYEEHHLKERDLDGQSSWDTFPWDVVEIGDDNE